MPEGTVTPTVFTVSLLPETNINHYDYAITVELRSPDRWAVIHKHWCLGADGEWDFEPRPSTRTDEWLATHRFDLDQAIKLALEAAPHVEVNGRTAEQVLALTGEAR